MPRLLRRYRAGKRLLHKMAKYNKMEKSAAGSGNGSDKE